MAVWKATLLLLAVGMVLASSAGADVTSGTADGSEEWGYTNVREGAHLFWWLYYSRGAVPEEGGANGAAPAVEGRPLIMWLQGGPGASGVGYGNFAELGPLTVDLKPRETSWLKAAHLLFVDNPVGTGYSYVDDRSQLTRTNQEITADLISFLQTFFTARVALQSVPFFVFCESYGGKYTSELAVAIHESLANGTLRTNFQGIAMGDSWISPIDFMKVWGPQLRTLGLLDDYGEETINRYAAEAERAIEEGRWADAATLWAEEEEAIDGLTDHVDFYNVLRHNGDDVAANSSRFMRQLAAHGRAGDGHLALPTERGAVALPVPGSLAPRQLSRRDWGAWTLARRHVARLHEDSLEGLMNGPIRKKLGIIPDDVSWGMSSGEVFTALYSDFMRPTIHLVDHLLKLGVNVTIFSGQLDLICCTDGTLNWMKALEWQGMKEFHKAPRQALYCPHQLGSTGGFVKRHRNLAFFWIMNAGHMVPADNGCMALKVVKMVTGQS